MKWHKGWSILALAVLLCGLVPAVVARAQSPGWEKVNPLLLDQLQQEGKAEFHVVMAAQADLSAAAALKSKVEKTTYVYETLRNTAAATQAPLLAYLKDRGVSYESIYIYNAIRVEAGATELQWLAARADVARIIPPPQAVIDPVYRNPSPTDHPTTIEWNVTRIGAPDVWNMGYRGEGMVVAGNDTGVAYTHPALVNQYRGNLGGGNFDHNYNWWNGAGSYAPFDNDGHGTHTMGTMVGDDGAGNQIGVAPGARWIACGGLSGTEPIDCFQFFLTPWDLSGQNPRPDLAPDAINNSWYDPSGYDYRTIIQNLNAAGIAVIKSAGNQGSGCNTITNPGYVPEVIATAAFAQGDNIASFSSRGPSSNYGETILKPEVAAPGVNVRSSYPPNGYSLMSGTSMAAPHSTALVALIWNAAPCIRGNVPLTKQIMMETAEPKIDPQCQPFVDHPNDVWGWGILDAQAAVNMAVGYCGADGYLNGLVTDASTGAPIVDATVTATGEGGYSESTQTDATGYYTMSLIADTYTVTAAALHYEGALVSGVVVQASQVTTQNFQLVAQGRLLGYVTDADSNAPLAATVTVAGVGSTPSDPTTGYYEIYLDAGTYDVTAEAPDYISETATVQINEGQDTQQDFSLLALVALVPDPIHATVQLGLSTTLPGQLINHMAVPYPFTFLEIDLSGGLDGSGGPDPFGYTYKDSDEPDGPRYEWIDATDGTPLGLVDDGEANVTMPFDLDFYGTSSTNLRVGNNGGLIFNATTGDLGAANADLGATSSNNLIVPFWDDIDSDTGNVYYKTVGTAPNRQFVIEWYNRPHYSNVGSGTFELILYEGTNNIKYQYADVVFGNGSYDYGASATVGIRQSGSNYLQYSYNQAVLTDGMSICFQYPGSPPCDPGDIPWYGTSIAGGTVPANDGTLGWTNYFTAAPEFGISQPGDYEGRLLVLPTGGDLPTKLVTVLLTVLPTPTMGRLEGTVTSNRPGGPLEATILVESGGMSWTLATDPTTGYYSYWLEAGAYNVTASAPGYVDQTAAVQITAQQVTTQDFQLELLAPEIVITPQSLAQSLPFGSVATRTLTIANDGLLPLDFEIQERAGTYVPPRGEANRILLMGEDLPTGGWDIYRTALNYAGVSWDEWDLDTTPFPTADELAPYEVLVWVDDNVLDPTDAPCQIVADWLVSGDKALFGAGRDFLWDLANGTPGAGEHNLYLLFQTTFTADYAGTTIATLDGVAGDIIGEDFVPPNGLTLDDTLNSNGDYSDENSPAPTGLIYGPGGAGSGHAGLTHLETGTYKTVWLGVNLHNGLTSQDQRNALMANIMRFLAPADVAWLSEAPITGTVAPGAAIDVDVVFDAGAVGELGQYTAQLRVRNNDPLAGAVDIPVTMTVEPGLTWGLLEGAVTGMGPCDAQSYPLTATVWIEGASGSYTLTTNPTDGSYSRWLEEGAYTVTAGAAGHLPATAVVQVIAQQTTTADLALRLQAPCLEVTPLAFSLTLPVNAQFTETLTMTNAGAGPLVWQLLENPAIPWVSEMPQAGTVPADNSMAVAITFDTTGLTPGGCYAADLELVHDDASQPSPMLISLELCVEAEQIPPVASFTSDAPGCLGQEVVFTNTTTGSPPLTYWWDFGDGITSTLENPTHLYAAAGSYLVILEAANAWGSDSYSATVEVQPLATASFDYSIAGLTATFTNTSLNADSYLWSFGDSATSTETNPVHTYAAAGVYTVTLLAGGPCNQAEASAVLYLGVCAPVEIVSVTSEIEGCVVTMSATLNGDPPITYLWDLGAFGTSTSPTPTVDFQATGTYSVTVEVTNCSAGYDSASFSVDVTCAPPVETFTVYLPIVCKNAAP